MAGRPFSVDTPSAGRLAGLRWGSTGGQRLLAVHGWLDNAASFELLAPLLTNADIAAIDLPGHGHSDHRPGGARYHLLDYLAPVLEAADALAWDELVLVGHSLGAITTALLSVIAPERVRGLVLIEGLGPPAETPQQGPQRLRRALERYRGLHGRVPPVYPDLKVLTAARVRVGDVGEAAARRLVERNAREVEGGFTWRSDTRLRLPALQYMSEPQVLAYLAAVTVPTLLLIASDGILVKHPATPGRVEGLQNAAVKTLPGGHHLHMENPVPVAEQVNLFLEHLATTG